MKKSARIFSSFFVLLCFIFVTACSVEDNRTFPTTDLSRQLELNFEDGSVCMGQPIKTELFVRQGDAKLVQLEIYENTTLIPADRLSVQLNGNTIIDNPISLEAEERTELTYAVEIQPDPLDTVGTINNYFFKIIDINNQPSVEAFTVEHRLPTIQLVDAQNFVFSDTSLFVCDSFDVQLQMEACWRDLSTLEIYQNGILLDDDNLDAVSIFESRRDITMDSFIIVADTARLASENPVNISDRDRISATFNMSLFPMGTVGNDEIYQYDFILSNLSGQSDTASITVTTSFGTPFEYSGNQRLFNQADGANSGGLDLDTGVATGELDSNAEIQDEGIRRAGQDVVWRQQISVVNATDSLKYYPSIRNVKADAFCYKEQLEAAFQAAFPLDGDDDLDPALVSDIMSMENVSVPVSVGDVFILRKGAVEPFVYYVFECVEIKDPRDIGLNYYEFLVKY